MKYTYLILLMPEMYYTIVECAFAPDINLEGRLSTNKDSMVLQLICSTNIAVQLCTAEFLIYSKTHDSIRYFDTNCYHTLGICSPTVCTCSGDCMLFKLNVTVTQEMLNHSYSCASRIEKDGVTYLANMSVIHDGNGGFNLLKKIVIPNGSVSNQQKTTNFSPELDTSSLTVPLIIISTTGCVTCILTVIVMYLYCRSRYNDSKKAKDELSNTKAQFYTKHATEANGLGTPTFQILPTVCCPQTNSDAQDIPIGQDEISNTETKSNDQDIFCVQAEISNNGVRGSVASSGSDNRSVDLLFNRSSDKIIFQFHHESTEPSKIV